MKKFLSKRRFFVVLACICLLGYFRNTLYTHFVTIENNHKHIKAQHGTAVFIKKISVEGNIELEPELLTVEQLDKLTQRRNPNGARRIRNTMEPNSHLKRPADREVAREDANAHEENNDVYIHKKIDNLQHTWKARVRIREKERLQKLQLEEKITTTEAAIEERFIELENPDLRQEGFNNDETRKSEGEEDTKEQLIKLPTEVIRETPPPLTVRNKHVTDHERLHTTKAIKSSKLKETDDENEEFYNPEKNNGLEEETPPIQNKDERKAETTRSVLHTVQERTEQQRVTSKNEINKDNKDSKERNSEIVFDNGLEIEEENATRTDDGDRDSDADIDQQHENNDENDDNRYPTQKSTPEQITYDTSTTRHPTYRHNIEDSTNKFPVDEEEEGLKVQKRISSTQTITTTAVTTPTIITTKVTLNTKRKRRRRKRKRRTTPITTIKISTTEAKTPTTAVALKTEEHRMKSCPDTFKTWYNKLAGGVNDEVMTDIQDSRELNQFVTLNCKSGEVRKHEICNSKQALKGPVHVNKRIQNLEWLYQNELSFVQQGGWYQPLDCLSTHHTAIIIPFRRREHHLPVLLRHLHPILKRQSLHYRIFVIEQLDNDSFNRAKLFNVGFKEASKLFPYDCFVFHDVDLVPENDRIQYDCRRSPSHMSVAVDTFDYRLPYDGIFGGVSSMSRRHFELVNGFSNMFWSWGGEDDNMSRRLSNKYLKINRQSVRVSRYTMLVHKEAVKKETDERVKFLEESYDYTYKDGLNSLRYDLVSRTYAQLFTRLRVNLRKDQDGNFMQ